MSATTWLAKVWSGLTDFDGDKIWTDGENIYYSKNSSQYVLDKETSTWSQKTWNGLNNISDLSGDCVWTDGENTYLSGGPTIQYVLDKSTSTWSAKTFGGDAGNYISGLYMWTDNAGNVYFNRGSLGSYKYSKADNGFVTWNIGINVSGDEVWKVGENIYWSDSDEEHSSKNHYQFIDNSYWSSKTWNGYQYVDGKNIWTDGTDAYYSVGSTYQYELDKDTSTWSQKTWEGLTNFSGRYVWTDGENTYYSSGSTQKVLDKPTPPPTPTEVYLSKITLPVKVDGVTSSVEFTLKDAEARGMIEDLGHALYWMGVTTTVMSDGLTTADVVIDGETVTPNVGGLVSYNGSEFVWNGTAWQEMGKNNFGALAFKSSAIASYTPAGTVSITKGEDATTSFTPFGDAGTLPTASWAVTGETAVFSFSAGTLPTAGTNVTAVTGSSTDTATFSGTQATITAE